ncbi:MAG: hypothetical protein ACOC1D_04670 [Prolixibacteraceae bacterium]
MDKVVKNFTKQGIFFPFWVGTVIMPEQLTLRNPARGISGGRNASEPNISMTVLSNIR